MEGPEEAQRRGRGGGDEQPGARRDHALARLAREPPAELGPYGLEHAVDVGHGLRHHAEDLLLAAGRGIAALYHHQLAFALAPGFDADTARHPAATLAGQPQPV